MKREDRTVKGLEELLKRKDAELEAERQKVAGLEGGAKEMSLLLDAILLTIAQEYGTEVPLGRRLSIPPVKVRETMETKELHVTRTEKGMELMALDRVQTEEAEERMT